MHLLKKAVIIALVATILYFLLGYHYVVVGNSIKMLKKSEYNLKYTFVSTKSRSIDSLITTQELWDDGIGELFCDEGMISEQELARYKMKMGESYY